jgi:hypothetical protein
MARVNVLKKNMQEREFSELTAEKAKLIIKTNSIRNSAELKK